MFAAALQDREVAEAVRYNLPVLFTLREYRADDFLRLWEVDQGCFAPKSLTRSLS